MDRRFASLLLALALLAVAPAAASAAAGIANHRALTRANLAAASESVGGSLIAPAAACPQQDDLAVGAELQQRAMRCMTNFARQQAGLAPLSDAAELDVSAAEKTGDLLACDSFSHRACDREFSYWIQEVGYTSAPCWHVGENLAWGAGESGTVRAIFRAWMRSPEHRRNVLGSYSQLGLALATGELEGQAGARVWTAHFGAHC